MAFSHRDIRHSKTSPISKTRNRHMHTKRPGIKSAYILIAAAFLFVLRSVAQSDTITLTIVSENNVPIRCDVGRYLLDGTEQSLGETDKYGQIKIPAECNPKTFLSFYPVEVLTYYGDRIACGDLGPGPIKLKSVSQPKPRRSRSLFSWNVERASINEAVAASQLADELDPPNNPNGHGDVYRIYSALVFARHMNVTKPLVLQPGSNQLAVSDSFRNSLVALQNGLQVPQTGKLDKATLVAAAGYVKRNGPDSLDQTMDAGSKVNRP
jgi:hypothetical protein